MGKPPRLFTAMVGCSITDIFASEYWPVNWVNFSAISFWERFLSSGSFKAILMNPLFTEEAENPGAVITKAFFLRNGIVDQF